MRTLIEFAKARFPTIYWRLKDVLYVVLTGILWIRGLKLPFYFDAGGRWIVLFRGIEKDVVNCAPRIIREGMVVLDVGANVGLLARQFCKLVGPTGRVLAFEPDPVNFTPLQFNLRRYPWAEVHPRALSDHNTPVTLHLHPLSRTGNSMVMQPQGGESIVVPCQTIDSFLAERPALKVDVIKIDVEGGELHVLRGMRETVKRNTGLRVIVEFCPKNYGAVPEVARPLLAELQAQGFAMEVIGDDGSTRPMPDFDTMVAMLPETGYVNLLGTRA